MRRLRHLVQSSESNTREIARGGILNAGGAGVGALASFGLLVVVTRGTSLDATGLFFEALALATAGSLVSSLGASTSMTRAVARFRRNSGENATTAIWAALLPITVTNVTVGVLGALAAHPLARALTDSAHADRLARFIVPMMLAVPFMALNRFFCAVSRAVDEPLAGVLYDLAGQPVLRLMCALLLVLAQHEDAALGLVVALPAVLCFLASFVHMRRALRRADVAWSARPSWRAREAAAFWRFSLPRGLEEVVQASNIWLLTLLVGALASPAQAAGYAAITRYTMATTLVLQSVTTALLPRLAAAFHRKDLPEANRIFQITTQWVIVGSAPVCLALLVFPRTLLSVVSPDLPDVRIGLQVLAVGSLVNVVTGPVGGVILMAGRSAANLSAAVASLTAMLVPALLLIPGHGASGAALAWAISIASQNLLLYAYGRKALSMSPWSRLTLAPTAVAFVAAALPMPIALILFRDRWSGLVVGTVLSCAIALAWLLSWARRSAGSA